MDVIEAYGRRLEASLWHDPFLFHNLQNSGILTDMRLSEFASNYQVGDREGKKNKIVELSGNYVACFFPSPSSDPTGPKYVDYCKYSLMKYKPWTGEPESVYGGSEASVEDIKNTWQSYSQQLLTNNGFLPDRVKRAIHYANAEGRNAKQKMKKSKNDDDFDDDDDDNHDYGYGDLDFSFNTEDNGYDEEQVTYEPWMEQSTFGYDDEPQLLDDDVVWHRNHDWSNLNNTFTNSELGNLDTTLKQQYDSLRSVAMNNDLTHVDRDELNVRQRLAHDVIVRAACLGPGESCTDGGEDVSRLIILTGVGGTGKSHVLKSVLSTLRKRWNWSKGEKSYS